MKKWQRQSKSKGFYTSDGKTRAGDQNNKKLDQEDVKRKVPSAK